MVSLSAESGGILLRAEFNDSAILVNINIRLEFQWLLTIIMPFGYLRACKIAFKEWEGKISEQD